MKKLTEDLTPTIASIMDHIKIPKSSSENKDSPKDQDITTVVLANKKAPTLEGGYSKRIGGMRSLKHETSLPKLCELLIKKDIKCCTAMDLKRFYNHSMMCINEVTILLEDLPPYYNTINRHADFEEYFIPD